MSFRIRKRIKLHGGLGINVSKSGISPSLRTRKGTISSKGYSIRTGISGVTYQKKFNAKNNGCMLFFIVPGIIILLKQLLCQ